MHPILLAAAALAAAPAPAETSDVEIRAKLIALDTDRDGRWSLTEWLAGERKQRGFQFIDANRDGYLSADEIRSARKKVLAQRATE